MLENTNIKQFYPGPILNKTLDITDFLFKNPEQIHITYTYKTEDGSLDNRELIYGTEYEVAKILPSNVTQADAALTASTGRVTLKADINVVLGERLTIYRESEIIQETQYPRTGPFPAASHEGALDYLTMQNQEQQDQINRSLKVPISTANFDGALPLPIPARALKINDSGSGFEFSEYDPDTALDTTKEYVESAQTAASNALASQNAAASSASSAANSASSAANSATEAENLVSSGIADINGLVTAADENLDAKIDAGTTTLNNTINTFKTYMNENPYSGKTIGEFFWTFRKDTINGAYECNGQEFEKSLFSGDQNPYDLLVAGKLPVKTYEEYQADIQLRGNCTYFGLDTTNQKFKVPTIKEIYVQADEASKVGQFVSETLPNISGELGLVLTGKGALDATGVFGSTVHNSGQLAISTGSNQGSALVRFDAFDASSVYRNHARVQPRSIKLRPMVQLITSATEVSFADYEEQFTAALNSAIASLTATGQAYLEDLTPNRFIQFSNRRRIKIKGNTYLRLDTKNYTVVGNPTITDNEILQNYGNSTNYITIDTSNFNSDLETKIFKLKYRARLWSNSSQKTIEIGDEFGTTGLNIGNGNANGTLYIQVANETSQAMSIPETDLNNHLGELYNAEFISNGTNYSFKITFDDGAVFEVSSAITTPLVVPAVLNVGKINNYSAGQIELQEFLITVDGKEVYKPLVHTLWYSNLKDVEVEAESLLDEGGTFQNGKAYNLFLVPNASYNGVELKVSLNSTAPTGYTPGNTRRVGGWHTLCVDVGDTSTWAPDHKLNGWLAGDILPQSVWTLYHRPYASPNNTIYIPCGIPFWRTIYDHSGSMLTTNFEYGGTVTRSKSFYGHMIDMMYAGYILPTYEQVAISGFDCEPLKGVMGKAEASITTAGGHVNESNHRIVSSYGAEDCAGCTWKIATIGAIGDGTWSTDPSVGIHQYGKINALVVGGRWDNTDVAGPFVTSGSNSALAAGNNITSFGVSYPLPRKSESTV